MLATYSCARARTVASEVHTEAQSFADCKLHIRTRRLASAFRNFWKTSPTRSYLFTASDGLLWRRYRDMYIRVVGSQLYNGILFCFAFLVFACAVQVVVLFPMRGRAFCSGTGD